MVAAAIAVTAAAGVAGSAMQASAAGSAASAQEAAANNATQAQLYMFNTAQQNLSPFITQGENANTALSYMMGPSSSGTAGTASAPGTPLLLNQNTSTGMNQVALNGAIYSVPESLGSGWQTTSPGVSMAGQYNPGFFNPITPNLATIAQTPGYQFDLNQGLKSTQNSAVARGLGVSGAALKGAASYATGLADNTYQNQFNDLITNQNNVYNRLMGQATLGANAAAGLSSAATQTGQGIASNDIGAGNAAAAGTIGTANAISSGISGAANNVESMYLLNSLMQSNGGKGLFG